MFDQDQSNTVGAPTLEEKLPENTAMELPLNVWTFQQASLVLGKPWKESDICE